MTTDLQEFDRASVLAEIRMNAELSHHLDSLGDRITQWLADYHAGKIGKRYASKDARLAIITDDDISHIAVSLTFTTLLLGSSTLQAYSEHLASQLRFDIDSLEVLKTSLEIVSICGGVIYEIVSPTLSSMSSNNGYYTISPLIKPDFETEAKLNACFFSPPSLSPIPEWKSQTLHFHTLNQQTSTSTHHKLNAILGSKHNRHDLPLNLATLNTLQKVKYELTPLSHTPHPISPDMDSQTAKETQKRNDITNYLLTHYENKPFSFIFQYDKRGRIYSKGYHINIQGDELTKARLQFSNKQHLTNRGIYWLCIDIANHYGLDKLSFDERLSFTKSHIDDMLSNPEPYLAKAESPYLLERALIAYKQGVIDNKPVGYICNLDATASGYQIMSLLTRDIPALHRLNILGFSERKDIYTDITKQIYELTKTSKIWGDNPDFSKIRSSVKKVIMTSAYNSLANPKELFGKDTKELDAYYQVIDENLNGSMKLLDIINSAWDDSKSINSWVLPDNHTAYCPVTKLNSKRLEVKELNNATIKFLVKEISPNPDEYRSLAPNIIHSIDAYICRKIIDNLSAKGIEVSPIHDSFGVHPNHCDTLRQEFRDIAAEIYKSDLIENILSQITGKEITINKPPFDEKIYNDIKSNIDGYYIC